MSGDYHDTILQIIPAPADLYVVYQRDGEPFARPPDCLALIERTWAYDPEDRERFVIPLVLDEGEAYATEYGRHRIGADRGEFNPDDWRGEAQRVEREAKARRRKAEAARAAAEGDR